MSNRITKKVCCPHCAEEVPTGMWSSIHAESSPELRTQILEETLFDWRCPACGYEAQLVYPCLYHDKERRFLLYIAPGCEDSAQQVDVEAEFPQLKSLRKRIVITPASLKEKILIFEADLDDRAVELVKLALASVVSRKNQRETTEGYFCFADPTENRIAFSFFLRGVEQPIRQGTRLEVYQKSLEIVQTICTEPDRLFQAVDSAQAQHILEAYKEK